MFEIFNNIQLTKNFQHITSVESNFRGLNQARIVNFLARVGSKHKSNGPRLARLEKCLARLGPGQKKRARYTSTCGCFMRVNMTSIRRTLLCNLKPYIPEIGGLLLYPRIRLELIVHFVNSPFFGNAHQKVIMKNRICVL